MLDLEVVKLRKARLPDVEAIYQLVQQYAAQGWLLPRSREELCEHLRDFTVVEQDGEVVACCALHLYGPELAEVRSLAVHRRHWRQGLGRRLVHSCLEEARRLGARRVFLLTYLPRYFEAMGFRQVDKASLPQKIWRDCIGCPRFPRCEEVAMEREP